MVEAILAVVAAVLGVVNTVVGGANARYLAKSAEYEANVGFQREKEAALYNIYGSQEKTRNYIIIGGFLFVLVLVFLMIYKRKK